MRQAYALACRHCRAEAVPNPHPKVGGHDRIGRPSSHSKNTRFEVETSDSGTTAEGQARRLDWSIQSVGGETILTVAVTVRWN
jgi:hypothetical protein